MLKYVTEHGGLYYGRDPEAVVAQMRRGEFRPEPRETDIEFMAAASRRIENLTGKALEFDGTAEGFLAALVERGFLRTVDDDIVCPLAHTLCTARRQECEEACWLKKAPDAGDNGN